jgi:hypothetical protein
MWSGAAFVVGELPACFFYRSGKSWGVEADSADRGPGYFDQAYFGHEFREFTGLTSARYSKPGGGSCASIPGHALDS